MRQVGSLNHSRWECTYHVIFIPKYRKKAIFGQIRSDLGEVLRRLAGQKESRIEEGHLMPDHVHPSFASAGVCEQQSIYSVRLSGKDRHHMNLASCFSANGTSSASAVKISAKSFSRIDRC